jgi:hypothetical protein
MVDFKHIKPPDSSLRPNHKASGTQLIQKLIGP